MGWASSERVSACLELAGAPGKGTITPKGRSRVDPAAIVAYLAQHPSSSGEHIAKALGTDTKTLRPTMKGLIAAGKARTKGKARGMRYFAVGAK